MRALGFYSGFAQRCFLARARHSDIINDLNRTGSASHTGGRAFVLADGRSAVPCHNSPLDMKAEAILANFRFGQFGADGGFDL
jgi:hypothetical protein